MYNLSINYELTGLQWTWNHDVQQVENLDVKLVANSYKDAKCKSNLK